jgi:hypothetical protein
VVISPEAFLATEEYEQLIIVAPNEIDTQWRCDLRVGGSLYAAWADNGYMALLGALRRYRETDPDLGVQTITVNAERGHHRKD